MTSGSDFIIRNVFKPTWELLDLAARRIGEVWPQVVFQFENDGGTVVTVPFTGFGQIPFGTLKEMFAYKNPAEYEAWQSPGHPDWGINTMVQLVVRENELTVVVDFLTDEIVPLLSSIESAVRGLGPNHLWEASNAPRQQ